ncbi:MAG TPA: ATP-binding protein, partial [Steroidobacteraceae bacterium]|nr:ATP-binding protein [Steroidobacteraceae bacterium]
SIKQQLFSIDVSAAAARARAGDSTATLDALDGVQAGARAAQAEMTALLQSLRPAPLENLGLVEALRDQVTAMGYRTGAEVTLSLGDLPPAESLPLRAQEEVFRMAQEALANVARHARARHVTLRMARTPAGAAGSGGGGALLLEVTDDGQGFDQASARMGMGLANLRERAAALGGTAAITSAPGAGTTVRVTIPPAPATPPITPAERARLLAVESASGRGGWWRAWANNLIHVAFLLLLLGLPFWAVLVGFGLAGVAAVAARASLNEVRRLAGAGSAAELELRKGDWESLTGLAAGGALCAWYLSVAPPPGWSFATTAAVEAVLVGAGLALWLWAWNGWRRASVRWYRMLDPARRMREVTRRWDETLGIWALIAIILVVAFFSGGVSLALAPRTPLQWTDTASVALIVQLVVMNGVETWLVLGWLRAARAAERAEREARA